EALTVNVMVPMVMVSTDVGEQPFQKPDEFALVHAVEPAEPAATAAVTVETVLVLSGALRGTLFHFRAAGLRATRNTATSEVRRVRLRRGRDPQPRDERGDRREASQ